MYDFLLAAHLLSAAALVAGTTYYTAVQLGAPLEPRHLALADKVTQIGAGLLLVFGVWLALYVDGYELWDGWILGSLALYFVAAGSGARIGKMVNTQVAAGQPVALRAIAPLHWLNTAAVVGILVLMIFKPGA